MSRLLTSFLLSSALTTVTAAQSLTLIEHHALVHVSREGQVAVGQRDVGDHVTVAARHDLEAGAVDLPGATRATAVDASGTVVVGATEVSGPAGWPVLVPVRREGAGPWVALPMPPTPPGYQPIACVAHDVSDDGQVAVGTAEFSWDGEGPDPLPYLMLPLRWTVGQPVELLPLPDGSIGFASRISGDGQRLGGTVLTPGGPPFGLAAVWSGPLAVLSWPIDDPFAGEPLPSIGSQVVAMDHDGGALLVIESNGGFEGRSTLLWRKNQPVVELPRDVPGIPEPVGRDLADDGLAVVGTQSVLLPGPHSERSWVWTPEAGLKPLEEVATQLGLPPGDPLGATFVLAEVESCSADGSVLVGGVRSPDDVTRSFRLELPAPSTWGTWEDLGQGLPGSQGEPVFSGEGLQVPGSETTLRVDNLQLLAQPWCVVGLSELAAPFKGGTLMPHPDLIAPLPPLGFGLSAGLTFAWPEGLPTDTELTWQVWVDTPDGSGPAGFAASNALRSTSG